MKTLAIETVFVFLLSLLGFIVFVMFFSDIRDIILTRFFKKPQEEEFEIEIISKANISKKFFTEILSLCVEKANVSSLRLEIFPCYYIFSEKKFENINLEEIINLYKNMNIRVNTSLFNVSKNYAIILFEKKTNKIYILN